MSKVQGSYPSATVTVYDAGTVTLSTIYADDNLTPKANPFTASADGLWFFYAPDGRYDVRFSGSGLAVPFTLGDFALGDEATSGVYTPLLTPETNVNSYTVHQFQYLRVGNVVTVSGRCTIDFVAGLVAFRLSLPVPSDFIGGAIGECSGVVAAIDAGAAYPPGTVTEDAVTNKAEVHLNFNSSPAGLLSFNVLFTYAVR